MLFRSPYNERRHQCKQGADFFHLDTLRQLSFQQFLAYKKELPEVICQRIQHVLSENQRVLQAKMVLEKNDILAFGKLMNESHASLRNNFAVSSHALDTIVQLAQKHGACSGAKMTGAGFGGCAVALVRRNQLDDFMTFVQQHYQRITTQQATFHICQAVDGVELKTWRT